MEYLPIMAAFLPVLVLDELVGAETPGNENFDEETTCAVRTAN